MAEIPARSDDLWLYLAGPAIWVVSCSWAFPYFYAARPVLQSGSGCVIWRGVRCSGLYGAAGGQPLRLADAERNARWAWHGRDNPRSTDHGDAVCRFSWRVSKSWPARPDAGRYDRRSCYDMGDVCALLSVDISGRTLHRIPAQQSRACPCLVRYNSCCCRCGAEPCDLVWSAGAVHRHGGCNRARPAGLDDRHATARPVQL